MRRTFRPTCFGVGARESKNASRFEVELDARLPCESYSIETIVRVSINESLYKSDHLCREMRLSHIGSAAGLGHSRGKSANL
jgi:hypothetical protein